MYIESFANNGEPYLRIVQSVRTAKPDGRKIPQKLYRRAELRSIKTDTRIFM